MTSVLGSSNLSYDAQGRLHVSSEWTGIGDNLFLTPALHEFHKRTGRDIVYHVPEATDGPNMLRNTPYITLDVHPRGGPKWGSFIYDGPEHITILGTPYSEPIRGRLTTIHYVLNQLRISNTPKYDRLMRIYLTDDELGTAANIVDKIRRPIIGIQTSGSKPYKVMARADQIADLVYESGMTPLVLRHPESSLAVDYPSIWGAGVWGAGIRHCAALISHLDGWIGHDSGPSYCAVALGIPSVILQGPINARGVLESTGHAFYRCLSQFEPSQCFSRFGRCCDVSIGTTTCPFMQRDGAQCIDMVEPIDIVAALRMVMDDKQRAA